MTERELLCALLTLVAVGSACSSPPRSGLLNPAHASVLAPDSAAALVRQCSRDAPHSVEGTWTPSAADIAAFDVALEPVLVEALSHSFSPDSLRPKLSSYYRQYVGIVLGGRRLIYVNGFQSIVLHDFPDSTAWQRTPVMVCDGGEAFFGAEYDPST